MKTWFEHFIAPKMSVGVGVSLLIGGAASILLILQSAKLLSKVSQRKIPSKKRSDKCVHCEAKVELDKLKEFVTCKGCEELACHNQKCSEFIFGLDVWECARCKRNRVIQQRAGEWLLKQLNHMKETDEINELKNENAMSFEDDESLATFVSRNQRDKVRQFIEELLAKMLNGPLDDVSVGQLSNDENCLPLIGPIPSTLSHHELRKFVQGICEEIINLPNTLDFSGVPGRLEDPLPYFDPKKYEKLLATAVLNKMTDFYQNDKNSQYNSSGVHSDIELDSNHNQLNGNAVIDLMVKRDEAGQHSSPPTIERLNSKVVDDETHLSDYVQSHYVPLPDLSATDSANDDGDGQSVDSSNATDATWEDNWLFKKRKLKTENQSIAMLVPSPTEEIKTLIGDKNADETSDLSENSDAEDEEDGKPTFTNTVLIDVKVKETPLKEVSTVNIPTSGSDSLKSMQSLTSLDTTNPTVITEAKNDLLLIDNDSVFKTPAPQEPTQKVDFILSGPVTVGEKPFGELSVQVDQPSNAEEEFDSIVSPTQVREHKKSIDEQFEMLLMDDNNNSPDVVKASEPVKKVKETKITEPVPTPAAPAQAPTKTVTEKRPSLHDPEKVLMKDVVPGSIAEREHLKWLHAAPIANNPYSSEALQRRLSETDNKHKVLNITNNTKLVDALIEESNMSEAEKEENEQVFQPKKVDLRKYKRDYYINDPLAESQKRYSNSSATSKSTSIEVDDDQSDNIVPVTSGEKGFRARTLHSGDIDSTGGSIASDQDFPENQGTLGLKAVRSNDDSLTYSEDSETTRIYNLNTRETKILVPVVDEVHAESPIESPVKLGQQFFRGSPKRNTNIRKMDDEVTTVIRTSSHNGDDGLDNHIVQETYEEKQVIEPEVIENLPSVKKLAEIYAKEGATTEIQLNKPKAFIATAGDEVRESEPVVHQKLSKSSSDTFAPNYSQTYHPAMPIASITARSIPAQIRADLKKSYSYDEESIVRHGEREGSPEIQAGVTRNSIAFFENLQKK